MTDNVSFQNIFCVKSDFDVNYVFSFRLHKVPLVYVGVQTALFYRKTVTVGAGFFFTARIATVPNPMVGDTSAFV